MIDAVKNYVRFDIPNEKGEKRRSSYNRLGAEGVVDKDGAILTAPEVNIPELFRDDWVTYFNVSRAVQRIKDSVCYPIPPSEWLAWKTLTKTEFNFNTVRLMDAAYCDQMNIELAEYRERTKPRDK